MKKTVTLAGLIALQPVCVSLIALGLAVAPARGDLTEQTPGDRTERPPRERQARGWLKLSDTPTLPGADKITFIDVHDHVQRLLAPEALISFMDRIGVNKIVAMGQARGVNATAQLALRAYERYPDRVIPFIGLNFMDTITRDILEDLDRQLSTGKFLGMGELHGRHYGFVGRFHNGRDITIPMDSPGVQDIMCLAAKYNVVVIVHMETSEETVTRFERALQNNPITKVKFPTYVGNLG